MKGKFLNIPVVDYSETVMSFFWHLLFDLVFFFFGYIIILSSFGILNDMQSIYRDSLSEGIMLQTAMVVGGVFIGIIFKAGVNAMGIFNYIHAKYDKIAYPAIVLLSVIILTLN